MSWSDNLISIIKNNITGICPICGSSDTAHEYITVESPNGYLSIWCNDCGARAAIDCLVPAESVRKTA